MFPEETIDADRWATWATTYDEDSWFYFVGRLKELIKFKGH